MTPTQRQDPVLHSIGIQVNTNGFSYSTPDNRDATTITVQQGHQVKWNCGHGNYSILFKGETPFADVGTHGRSGSDTAALTVVGAPGSYKYAVHVVLPDGVVVDDPEIIVESGNN
jgi:hypothetical protein